MANSLTTSCSELKLRKRTLKPPVLMLKDYLLDDLSSCSSNGFQSFPRRQCCTTVRFLLEIDLNESKQQQPSISKNQLLRSRSKAASASSATLSVLHRASEAVINAVKHFPFTGGKAMKASILRRSFSRKLLRQSFWKRSESKEIKRLKSFGELIREKDVISELTTTVTTVATTATTTTTELNTSTSDSNSWSDSDFTVATLDNSEVNSSENDVVESIRNLPEKQINKRVDVTTTNATNYSAESTKKEWQNEEKEQFSPVYVMDFPCDDDRDDDNNEIELSYPFHCMLHIGSKRKLKHKVRRFESLTQLEPVDLEKRIAISESNDMHELVKSLLQPCSTLIHEEGETEQKATELLEQMKTTTSSNNFACKVTKSLLLSFFMEKIIEDNACDHEVLEVAKDWMKGQPRELFLEWEVKRNREIYIRDMEKGVKWSKLDDEEKREVVLEVEDEVFTYLVNEVLLDLFTF